MADTLYDTLRKRTYREYSVCQLPGCNKPLKRMFHQKVRKYCSLKHAKEAQKLYLREWRRANPLMVKLYNKRHSAIWRKKVMQGIINPIKKEHEIKTFATD